MTIDAAGKLWVVLGESGCVVQVRCRCAHANAKNASHFLSRALKHTHTRIGLRRAAQYDPTTGAQLAAVALPVKRPTACTFGARRARLRTAQPVSAFLWPRLSTPARMLPLFFLRRRG